MGEIGQLIGNSYLYFFDAMSPIVSYDSLDKDNYFIKFPDLILESQTAYSKLTKAIIVCLICIFLFLSLHWALPWFILLEAFL